MELEQFNDNISCNLFRSDSMIIMVVYTYTHTHTHRHEKFQRILAADSCIQLESNNLC